MRKFVHYSPLFNYIKNGETAKITSYLSSATISEINYHAGKSLKTPLHFAVIYQNIESIILLLHHGADPNAEDKYGKNPVYYVVKSKFLDAVVAFRKYQKGRTPTSEDIDMYWNFFPVNWSLLQFQLEKFLKFLIDVDINLNLKNSSGYDGLFLCLVSSPRIRYKMGAVFLRLVGDLKITWRDNNGHNVLHVSAIRGYHLATQLLIRYKPILATLPDHDGKVPLNYLDVKDCWHTNNILPLCRATLSQYPGVVFRALLETSETKKYRPLDKDFLSEILKQLVNCSGYSVYCDLEFYLEIQNLLKHDDFKEKEIKTFFIKLLHRRDLMCFLWVLKVTKGSFNGEFNLPHDIIELLKNYFYYS